MLLDPMFLGAKYSLSKSDPEKIVQEGIALMNNEGYYGKRIMYDELPNVAPAISMIHPLYIDVEKDSVTIKKVGIFGDFAGFIVTLKHEPRQSTKIIDGLFWVQWYE